jgi:hypothetical protein
MFWKEINLSFLMNYALCSLLVNENIAESLSTLCREWQCEHYMSRYYFNYEGTVAC